MQLDTKSFITNPCFKDSYKITLLESIFSTCHCGKPLSTFCDFSTDLQLKSTRCRYWATYIPFLAVSSPRSESGLEDGVIVWKTRPPSVWFDSQYRLWICHPWLQPERWMPSVKQSCHLHWTVLIYF